jgi:hypothetical protein
MTTDSMRWVAEICSASCAGETAAVLSESRSAVLQPFPTVSNMHSSIAQAGDIGHVFSVVTVNFFHTKVGSPLGYLSVTSDRPDDEPLALTVDGRLT